MRTSIMGCCHLRRLLSGLACWCVALCLAICSSPAVLGQTASISEIGIQGFYAADGAPTRVRVQLSNPSGQPQTLHLTFSVSEKEPNFNEERVDKFTASATLQPSESRSLDLPIPLWAPRPVITLDAITADGRAVAHQTERVDPRNPNALVLLLCNEEKTCNEVLGAIESSGDDEQKSKKTKVYTYLVSKDALDEWWAYSPVQSVVLARPASSLTAEQRLALEGYARQRGQLALIEELVGPGFLDAYRPGGAAGVRYSFGTGWLLRFSNANELAAFFDRSVLDAAIAGTPQMFRSFQQYRNIRTGYSGQQLATIFDFPTFRWLVVWLIAYIAVVGLLNFYILTRLNRRELAWVTVPAIALAFAMMLYFLGTAKRPRTAGLDEVATYYLDDRSPTAAAVYDLRISSPVRQELTVRVPGEAVWSGTDRMLSSVAGFSVFDRRAANASEGWSVRLLPEKEFSTHLLQWSYQDLSLAGVPALPGTIRRLADGRLVNETGFSFRQAEFRSGKKVYDVGAVAAGATFNPTEGAGEDVERVMGPLGFEGNPRFDRNSHEDIKRFLVSQPHSAYPTFVGLAEAPALGADLPGHPFAHQQYVVVLATMWSAP